MQPGRGIGGEDSQQTCIPVAVAAPRRETVRAEPFEALGLVDDHGALVALFELPR